MRIMGVVMVIWCGGVVLGLDGRIWRRWGHGVCAWQRGGEGVVRGGGWFRGGGEGREARVAGKVDGGRGGFRRRVGATGRWECGGGTGGDNATLPF